MLCQRFERVIYIRLSQVDVVSLTDCLHALQRHNLTLSLLVKFIIIIIIIIIISIIIIVIITIIIIILFLVLWLLR